MNQRETIDGIKGEWRTVTKSEQVDDGQRIRYFLINWHRGFSNQGEKEKNRFAVKTAYGVEPSSMKGFKKDMFKDRDFKDIQAFFPLPDKPKRKVTKVTISQKYASSLIQICGLINGVKFYNHYSSRKSALRGARRFCKAISYECEIIK